MSVVEPITKFSLWPITKHTGNPMNQSKLESNTCSRGKAREKRASHVRVTRGFGVTSNWMEKWRDFLSQLRGTAINTKEKANYCRQSSENFFKVL